MRVQQTANPVLVEAAISTTPAPAKVRRPVLVRAYATDGSAWTTAGSRDPQADLAAHQLEDSLHRELPLYCRACPQTSPAGRSQRRVLHRVNPPSDPRGRQADLPAGRGYRRLAMDDLRRRPPPGRPTLDLFVYHRAYRALRSKVAPEQEITGSLHSAIVRPRSLESYRRSDCFKNWNHQWEHCKRQRKKCHKIIFVYYCRNEQNGADDKIWIKFP